MSTPMELRDRLIGSALCPADKLRGCTEKQLLRIETQIGHPLPAAYKDVMRVMGRGAGDFESDLEMFYPTVMTLTKRTRKLHATEVTLPDDAFVFADRYGEVFAYFRLLGSDDPPIYRWGEEDTGRPRRVFKSIWKFIEVELEGHEYMLRGKRRPDRA